MRISLPRQTTKKPPSLLCRDLNLAIESANIRSFFEILTGLGGHKSLQYKPVLKRSPPLARGSF